jgi:hypothetical protein
MVLETVLERFGESGGGDGTRDEAAPTGSNAMAFGLEVENLG